MTAVQREELRQLLGQWRDGSLTPSEVVAEARSRWVAGDGVGADSIAGDVLAMLATADQGFTHEDIPALLEWLATPAGEESAGLERFGDYILGLDVDERGRLPQTGYYGPAAPVEVDMEFYIKDPDERRIHKAIREDPESVWAELRRELCEPPRPNGYEREMFLTDLLEDLLAHHGDAFIDRLEELADQCPESRPRLSSPHTGGFGGPAIARFEELQRRVGDAATR